MTEARAAFVTGRASRLHQYALAAKYYRMRRLGVVYPDVFCLPYFFTDRFDFVSDGRPIASGRYDVVFAELNRGDAQLEYLARLVDAGVVLAVIPGPPEFLARELTQHKLDLVRHVLGGARMVLAYAGSVQRFCDGLLGAAKAVLTPWPFDLGTIRRAAGDRPRAGGNDRLRVLLGSPVRFSGTAANHPFLLKAAVSDALAELPARTRRRFSFHCFAYTDIDRRSFSESGFSAGLPIRLEPKMSFRRYVRLIHRCDAAVNLTTETVLGRVTFIAAALGTPGLFSSNGELNRELYPGATVAALDTSGLRAAVVALLEGVAGGAPPSEFLPDGAAVARVGDFERNTARFRALLRAGGIQGCGE
jgi:hypothetical protein